MPVEKLELRVSFKRLLIGLLITVVPISIVGIYAITKSDSELQHMVGTHFKIFAESTAQELTVFIEKGVRNVGTMATEPAIIKAVTSSNVAWSRMSDDALTARIKRIEKEWNTPAVDSLVTDILSSDAAFRLRRYREMDPRFLRITVTDANGVTVAATDKTLDYLQADEEFWQAIYANGRGAISVTDILYDDVTKKSYVGMGRPILEEGTGRFIGAVDALVDLSSLLTVINRPHPPLSLQTTLVRDDGTVISGPEVNLSMKLQSPEYLAVQDSLSTLEGRQTGYLVASIPNARTRLIGFADTGLKSSYPNLGWVVLVSQDASEAFASIRVAARLIWLLALVGLAMVVFVAMYFSLHRHEPFEDRHQLGEAGPPPAA